MGVHGWNWFLKEEGWLPDTRQSCCSQSLWRNPSSLSESDAFASRIVPIPDRSVLHVDGNGLAFFLHRAAYARHVAKVIKGGNNKQLRAHSNACTVPKQSLSTEQVRRLLPNFMPLTLLSDAVREFASQLQDQHGMKLLVYWDGEQRRVFKHETDKHRQTRRPEEWSNVQHYCQYGMMPASKTICEWEYVFPKSRLFTTQIMNVLQTCGAEMIHCEEEADHIIAERASNNPNHYVLGNDSDFCFFPNVNYIPFATLDAQHNTTTACVIRRAEIAEFIGLPEELMIELAILMGNDYVDPRDAKLNFHSRNVYDLVEHLRDQVESYRVTSQVAEIEEALRFIRILYNFGDLSEFPFDERDSAGRVIDENDMACDSILDNIALRPTIPDEVPLELAKLRPFSDISIKDAALRCLQTFVDQTAGNEANSAMTMIRQEHLDVFRDMALTKCASPGIQKGAWRPLWEDVPAAYLIEKIVAHSFEESGESPVVRVYDPFQIFDQHIFHDSLRQRRAHERTRKKDPVSKAVEPSIKPRASTGEERLVLPVDEHEEIILASVRTNRVTIIQGETGCGKSSRIPIMLLKAPCPIPTMNQSKMYISQPRRIAAKALVERVRSVEPELKNVIALRMGHGVCEYESKKTRAWFVTTGYLVRVLANHPEKFDRISYLVIDEVHERSVDTDILCLLCRRLLKVNQNIRLVLMSATLAASLYQEYFNTTEPPIKVGARRFPVKEVFLEDLQEQVAFSQKEEKTVNQLASECNKMKCAKPPSLSYMEKIFSLVSHIAMFVGRPGSSVLIFVPGMNEIVAITELVEQQFKPGVRFTCFPIHSDIPFEDQMIVFDATAEDEVKIIIATNAAESSVTLPDVDHVICLGLCKQIVYNEASHRQILMPTWISKASATQRAGRTGRLRPGTVYRMYTREVYRHYMDDFEPGEMVRIPLDSVILMLKEMLSDEDVTKVLLDCLEPPNIATIDRSFQSLYKCRFITSAEGDCEITSLGSFVLAMGVDLLLGSLVGLGIQFGVGAEAVQMAAVLSFPKTPWIMSNPLIHESKDYNEMTTKTYVSRCHFDANLFSEPLSAMNLIWEFEQAKNQANWCWKFGISYPRIKRLAATSSTFRRRVADFLSISTNDLELDAPPLFMPHSKVTLLRVIQVWVFNDSIIECRPRPFTKGVSGDKMRIDLGKNSKRIDDEHLHQILSKGRHPFALHGYQEIEQRGSFEIQGASSDSGMVSGDFEERFLSYAVEKEINVAWITSPSSFVLYVRAESSKSKRFAEILTTMRQSQFNESSKFAFESSNKKGRGERPAGMWSFADVTDGRKETGTIFKRFMTESLNQSQRRFFTKALCDYLESQPALSGVSCDLLKNTAKPIQKFSIVSRGRSNAISPVDLNDLFAASGIITSKVVKQGNQAIIFSNSPSMPLECGTKGKHSASVESSWDRPIFHPIPEGARILSILASGRRKEHVVRLSSLPSKETLANGTSPDSLDIYMEPGTTNVSKRWKRFNTAISVYVQENSVPASALPMNTEAIMYCCCANTLEVRGGGLRVEGLTLLPPGRPFLLLCRLAFGLFHQKHSVEGTLEDTCLQWVLQDLGNDSSLGLSQDEMKIRIKKAISFHRSVGDLGEQLVCFDTKVAPLLEVFDGVDGYESKVWKDLKNNPMTSDNLKASATKSIDWKSQSAELVEMRTLPKQHASDRLISKKCGEFDLKKRSPKKDESSGGGTDDDLQRILAATQHLSDEKYLNHQAEKVKAKNRKKRASKGNRVVPSIEPVIFEQITNPFELVPQSLFLTELPDGVVPIANELHSTNILALVVQHFMMHLKDTRDPPYCFEGDWSLYRGELEGKQYFYARFLNRSILYRKQANSIQAKQFIVPKWIRENEPRPSSVKDAINCLPPRFSELLGISVAAIDGCNILLFSDVTSAMRMESAFWLERHFRSSAIHWYEQSPVTMVEHLIRGYQW